MAIGAARNLHVPLPDHIHTRLRLEASRTGRPATVLAREAIERWLDELQRVARDRAVAEYAQEAAGTRDDMDRELEAAGIEVLAGKVRRRR